MIFYLKLQKNEKKISTQEGIKKSNPDNFFSRLYFIALTTLASAGMFAIQTDDIRRGFSVSRGVSFYLVVVCVILTILLCVLSIYDLIFSRRSDGDPTQVPDVTGSRAITYDNPGYREGDHSKLLFYSSKYIIIK